MHGGGGSNFASGVFPSFTMNTVSIPHVKCRSKWQCMNQTPVPKFLKENMNITNWFTFNIY